MAILSKQIYCSTWNENEDQFTYRTNIYISQNYPFLNGFYFHIANERSNKREAIKLKSMGVLPGVPDFCFVPVRGPRLFDPQFPLWFLELKMLNGKLSPAQKKVLTVWSAEGIETNVAYSPGEVCLSLERIYGKPKFEA